MQTIIGEEAGKLFVRKKPLNPSAGKEHVSNFAKSYSMLNKHLHGCEIVKCKKGLDVVYFDFVEGKSLLAIIEGLLIDHQYEQIESLLSQYVNILTSIQNEPNDPYESDLFVQKLDGRKVYAGQVDSDNVITFAPLDLIPSNIIVAKDKWTLVDYEWTYPFPVERDYILFRGLLYTCHSLQKVIRKRVSTSFPCYIWADELLFPVEWHKTFRLNPDDFRRFKKYEDHLLGDIVLKYKPTPDAFPLDVNKVVDSYMPQGIDRYMDDWRKIPELNQRINASQEELALARADNSALQVELQYLRKLISEWEPLILQIQSNRFLRKLTYLLLAVKQKGLFGVISSFLKKH